MGKIVEAIFGKEEKPAQAIPLDRAVLCMNCESVFEVEQRVCPRCCSEVFLNIGLALSDEATKGRVREINDAALEPWRLAHGVQG